MNNTDNEFKVLGYDKIVVTDNKQIIYRKEYNENEYNEIIFDLDYHNILIGTHNYKSSYTRYGCLFKEELDLINKKVIELGWEEYE